MNICIIVLDSLRKDFWDTHAPRLKALADVKVDRCIAPSSWSAPSHASMFTGQLPSEIGIHTYQKSYDNVSLSETLFDTSLRRVGISSNMYVNVHYNFDKFFDDFYNLHAAHPYPDGINVGKWLNEHEGIARFPQFIIDALKHPNTLSSLKKGLSLKLDDITESIPIERPLDEGARAINRRMRKEATDEPWLMFVNHMETHTPHRRSRLYDSDFTDAPPTWSSYDFDHWEATMRRLDNREFTDQQLRHMQWFKELYSASADYIDRRLSETIQQIQDRTSHETVFIITADHGENLFISEDENVWGHSSSMSEALLHVPFVIINAPEWISNQNHSSFSLLDLPQLIRNILNREPVWPSRSKVPAELVGGGVGLPDERHEFLDRAIRVVYQNDKKWQWDTNGYRNNDDWDSTVEEVFPEPIDEMKKRESNLSDDTDLNEEAISRLEDLGYV